MNESGKRHKENSNLVKEIRASKDVAIKNQGASIKALEIHIRQMSKVLQERGSGSLPRSAKMNPRDHNSKLIFKPRQTTIPFPSHLYDDCYDEEKGSYGLKDLDAYSIRTTLHNDSLLKKEKYPGSFTLPCYINNICFEKALANLGASASVMPLSTYLNLGLGELAHTKLIVELTDRTVKHPKGIAKNILVGIGKFVFLVDFIILYMLEDVNVPLILGRPFLSTAHAKVDAFKRKITLRKKSSDDLEPTVDEGEVVNEPIINIVKTRYNFIGGLDDYPSNCDFDRRIHIDCAYNLKFSCMMGFEYVHTNFLLILPINVMSKKFYNSVMKGKINFKERNKLGNFVNAPVFIGNFYVITDFTVVEDMDPYPDEGMRDVIVGEPFCKASCVEDRMFDGIITIRDGDDSVTYQMVRSNPRFKHLTNKKCNKIPPLLKVSEQDKMNGISHSYQMLKGFYKGVLNLGPEFIRDAKVEEWLTRGYISVYEME
ncbi:homeodomain-like protein [Tanacetum coccineum]